MHEIEQIKPFWKNQQLAKAICFSLDDYYVPYFAVALQSIIENARKNEYYDIVVFSKSIKEENKTFLQKNVPKHFSIRFFEVDDLAHKVFFKDENSLPHKDGWDVIYYRLLIPIVMQLYERVLFLDCDLVVCQNLSELFQMNHENKSILCVADHFTGLGVESHEMKHVRENIKLNDSLGYFNAGVLMIIPSLINVNSYIKNLRNLLKLSNFKYKDQDILNVIFENDKKLINPKYNIQTGIFYREPNFLTGAGKEKVSKSLKEAIKKPAIVHYTGGRKPWKSLFCEFQEEFYQIADKTELFLDNEILVHGSVLQQIREMKIEIEEIKIYISKMSIYRRRMRLHWFAAFFSKKHKIKYEKYKYLLSKFNKSLLDV